MIVSPVVRDRRMGSPRPPQVYVPSRKNVHPSGMQGSAELIGRAALATAACAILLASATVAVSGGAVAVAGGSVADVGGAVAPSEPPEEGPRAEAGVDQTVPRNATVLLDGTQSWSPDGELVNYEWRVESPTNRTVEPVCETESCRLARFRAPEYGAYDVQLTVEDEVGRTQTDLMYVRTEARSPFDVTLDGSSGALVANVTAGNATLANLTWIDGDGVLENRSLSGAGGTYERETPISAGEPYAVAVRAADGRVVGDTWRAPTADVSELPDYPYIDGPIDLTGDAVYDEEHQEYVFEDVAFRVETRDWYDAEEVIWSRDGDTVSEGRTYVDDFTAGNHSLSATVHFANSDAGLDSLEHVGTGVSDSLGVFLDDQSDRVWVRANPKPDIRVARFQKTGDQIKVRYDVKEPLHKVGEIRLAIDGEVQKTQSVNDVIAGGDISAPIPPETDGSFTTRLVAEDTTGLGSSSNQSYYIEPDDSSMPNTGAQDEIESTVDDALEWGNKIRCDFLGCGIG